MFQTRMASCHICFHLLILSGHAPSTFAGVDTRIHVYQLNEDEVGEETDGDEFAAYQHWILPNRSFSDLWERFLPIYFLSSDCVIA